MTRDQYNADVIALAAFYAKRNADRREFDHEIDAVFSALNADLLPQGEVDELIDQLAVAVAAYRLPDAPPARELG